MKNYSSLAVGHSGQSITMVLVSIGISGIIAAALATMLTNAQRETLSLSQKLDTLSAQNFMLATLSNPAVCSCNFDPTKNSSGSPHLTFNAANLTASTELTVDRLYTECTGGALANPYFVKGLPLNGSPTLVVSKISLSNISGSAGNYTGKLSVEFDSNRMVMSRKPASIAIAFTANVTNPTNAVIQSCSAVGGSSGGALANCTMQTKNWTYGTPSSCSGDYMAGALKTCDCPQGRKPIFCMITGSNCSWGGDDGASLCTYS